MKLTLEQIEEANKETLENKNISLTPEQIEEANSAEISDPSIMADIGRVLMDTSENIAFAPLNLANIISEQVAGKKVVPDWYFNEARKNTSHDLMKGCFLGPDFSHKEIHAMAKKQSCRQQPFCSK